MNDLNNVVLKNKETTREYTPERIESIRQLCFIGLDPAVVKQEIKQIIKKISKFQEAKKEVKALYEKLKAEDDSIRISTVYNNYIVGKGFKNWNQLSAMLKQEDLANDVCWHCNDFTPPSNPKWKCTECGRGK